MAVHRVKRGRLGRPIVPSESDGFCLKERGRNLRSLGYDNYPQFLAGGRWLSVKYPFLQRNTHCQMCGVAAATNARLMRYKLEDLNGTCTGYIVALCDVCFKKVSTKPDGKERTPKQAWRYFNNRQNCPNRIFGRHKRRQVRAEKRAEFKQKTLDAAMEAWKSAAVQPSPS